MKKLITTLIIGLIALNPIMANAKICSKQTGENEYIKLNFVDPNSVSFERCMGNASDEMCFPIANGKAFSFDQIKNEKLKSYAKAAGVGVLDTALVVGAAYIGLLLGASAALGGATGSSGGIEIILYVIFDIIKAAGGGIIGAGVGGTVGAGTAFLASSFFDSLNPVAHFKNARALAKTVDNNAKNNDHCMFVSTSVSELSARLEKILNDVVPEAAIATNMEKQLKTRINELAVQDNAENAQNF